MSKIMIIIPFLISFCFGQSKKEIIKNLKEDRPEKVYISYDKYNGKIKASYKYNFGVPNESTLSWEIYFFVDEETNKVSDLYLTQRYHSDDWLFINRFTYVVGGKNDKVERFSLDAGTGIRNVYTGRVSERYTTKIEGDLKLMFYSLYDCNCALSIKLSGDSYYKTFGWTPFLGKKMNERVYKMIKYHYAHKNN
tara:strand:- start:1731 stop:2312 length:582 start_codon:yes stop_codon:yes gene_type:complete